MFTEKQASEKICPHLPVDIEVEPVNNVVVHRVIRFANCWASKCSQWRWDGSQASGEASDPDRRQGACGLAGGKYLPYR